MNASKMKVGDVVIVLKKYRGRPETDNVGKVTPTGMIEVNSKPGVKFKWHIDAFKPIARRSSVYEVYPYSEDKLNELNATAAEYEKRLEEEKDYERVRLAKLKAERDAMMDETKAAIGDWNSRIEYSTTIADMTLYAVKIPVHPNLLHVKGTSELVLIKLRKVKEYNWSKDAEEEKYETHITTMNASTHSFGSYSGRNYETLDEAVWEALLTAYNGH